MQFLANFYVSLSKTSKMLEQTQSSANKLKLIKMKNLKKIESKIKSCSIHCSVKPKKCARK